MSAVLSMPLDSPVLEQPLPAAEQNPRFQPPGDFVSIRGVQLPRAELVDRALFSPAQRDRLRNALMAASPFPHLVLENLFNPALLDLAAEEFDAQPGTSWSEVKSRYESTRRSVLGPSLGPATQLYFDTIHSGWFIDWLSSLTGVPYLLADPKLFGGGLHESRTGATFAVHRDFNRHRHLGLKNEMVFITYLNKGWNPDWGSGLELWDKKHDRCVTTVQPEFGRTILLPHGPISYHGHTKPLQAPDGRPRRSVAAYYYSSPLAGKQHGDESASVFMKTHRVDRAKAVARMITPPVVWLLARKITGRA
ncbi:putative proline hydroxylase [Variovorax sp. PBL-H6]|uniref:2OG-Fe(II) oxygenase n=1 Tax=Variovorax sp. PBL-H6 TaxID=434009 RepID=UPI0013160DAF|nr:2OG-Fe(II) oxygenase [Variovorax sp. PBL-H6]VTU36825.1 putative proline hydroxylase [Variovorax sp. PBL-H6]